MRVAEVGDAFEATAGGKDDLLHADFRGMPVAEDDRVNEKILIPVVCCDVVDEVTPGAVVAGGVALPLVPGEIYAGGRLSLFGVNREQADAGKLTTGRLLSIVSVHRAIVARCEDGEVVFSSCAVAALRLHRI